MRWAIAAALLVWTSAPALAADAAQHHAIGYSTDGRYFAFEQYGVQDGSGFPYWDVFILDLDKDTWAAGSPFRVTVEDENAKLADARQQAHAKADGALTSLKIGEPPELLLANPATEVVFDRTSVRFNPFYTQFGVLKATPDDGVFELSVRTLDLPIPADCTDPDFKPKGMELVLTNRNLGTTVTLAKDQEIPASRGCPLYYDIEAVYLRTGYDPPNHSVALIGVFTRGFEGDDRRFIAVPFDMSD